MARPSSFPRLCPKKSHVLLSGGDLAADRSCARCKKDYARRYRRRRAGLATKVDDRPERTRVFWVNRITALGEQAERETRAWLRAEIEAELEVARRGLAELVRFEPKK